MYKRKGVQVQRVSRSLENSQDKVKNKCSSSSSTQIASIENLLSGTIQERVRPNANSTSIYQSGSSQCQLKRGMDISENISPIKKSSLARADLDIESARKSYVEAVLHDAGMNFIVSSFDQNLFHELRTDQAMFVRSVQLSLSENNKEKVNVDLFMEDFSKLHQDTELLVRSLSPTHTMKDCDLARGAIQDSLIRLLLQVDCLHCSMGDYLLEKLGEFTLQDFRDENLTLIEMVGMILSPLRHMNLTKNSAVLCERMLELISLTSNTGIKQIIITCIPDILSDNDHFTAASELAKMLKNTPELTVAILDTLNNLSLANDLKCGVRRCMITCLQRADINFLPSIIKFLITTSDADSWDEIINGVRSELFTSPCNISTQSQSVQRYIQLFGADGYFTQKAIFDNIREGLLISRKFADAWIKNITLLQMQQSHRPVDIIILLIVHDIASDNTRKRSLENVIKNKIRNGLFVTKILEDAFQTMPTIIEQYFSSLMELLSNLLRSPDPTLSEFAFISYRICFEKMTGFWCKNLVKELLGYIGAGDTNNASVALNVLSDITSKFPGKIKPIASILKVLFNKMEDLELSEVQQSMDILCCIAFSEGDEITAGTLQDDLNILLRKQLTNSRIQYLRNGVVGAIMAIKHITKLRDGETNISLSDTQVCRRHLTQRAKRALPFLELLMENTRNNPEARALFFDQLSSALLHCEYLDNSFKQYLARTVEDLLKEFFLIEWQDYVPVEKFECDVMFGLDGNDKEQVVLNLIPQLIEDRRIDNKPQLPVVVLHSLFRLIRVIHSDNLESVNALLGCPVVFPVVNTLDQFSSLAIDEQVIVMDSLFHCINWFREIINSFAYLVQQNEPKVLMRLRAIIWIQNWIAKCLPQMFCPDYCPPKCYFHVASRAPVLALEKKRKRSAGKKTAQKEPEGNTSAVVNDPSISEESVTEKPKNTANVKAYKSYFRSMDIDVWIMLTTPLTLNPQACKDVIFTAELGPSELLFLLEEFVGRLQCTLPSTVKKGYFKNLTSDAYIMSSRLYMTSPEFVVKYVIKLLPSILQHLEKISKYTRTLLKANDNVLDSPGIHTSESKQLNSCLELILKGMVIFFSWSPFQISCNQEHLLDGLRVIASKGNKSQCKEKSFIKSVVKDCIQYMGEYQNSVLHLEAAVNLVSLLHIFWKYGEDGNSREKIGEICKQFLSHRWFNLDGSEDKGSSYNKNIEILLSIYMQGPNKLELLQTTVSWLEEEIDEFSKTEKVLRTFPTFNKGNFSIIIRVICVTLELVLKESSDVKTSDHDRLNVWMSITAILKSVVSILKKQDSRMNLIAFLKGSIPILQSFFNNGLAICSMFLREKHSDVISLVKGMQITTRCIQQICNYTKKTKDSTLNAHLPKIRSLLEAIVWRVKRMTVVNNCKDAFFMGMMKNKDIHGNNMTSSQSEEMEYEESDEAEGLLNLQDDNQEEEVRSEPTTDILSGGGDSPPMGDISDGGSTVVTCGEEEDIFPDYMEESD